MARKGKRQKITRLKVSSSASKNRTQDTISRLVRLSKLSSRSLSARDRAFHVPADMRRDPNLTFTQAAANRGVDRYTVHKYVDAALRTDSSGKIKARPTDHLCETLYIP